MGSAGIARLIADLLYVVQAIAAYPNPARPPLVKFVSHVELQEMACEAACDIRGWYAGGSTIYLDDGLDPENSLWDRSILVHEMVHYLQDQAGAFGSLATCQRWLEREDEAYAVQHEWLRANPPGGPPPAYARFPRIVVDCES